MWSCNFSSFSSLFSLWIFSCFSYLSFLWAIDWSKKISWLLLYFSCFPLACCCLWGKSGVQFQQWNIWHRPSLFTRIFFSFPVNNFWAATRKVSIFNSVTYDTKQAQLAEIICTISLTPLYTRKIISNPASGQCKCRACYGNDDDGSDDDRSDDDDMMTIWCHDNDDVMMIVMSAVSQYGRAGGRGGRGLYSHKIQCRLQKYRHGKLFRKYKNIYSQKIWCGLQKLRNTK